MSNYYTPKIEECHIGFEYEWKNDKGEWIKESSPESISEDRYEEQTYGLRVRYLDQEDIESFGFENYVDRYRYGEGNDTEYMLFHHQEDNTITNFTLHVKDDLMGNKYVNLKVKNK